MGQKESKQKKKLKNKQNFHPIKKTTIHEINYTEQLHIPTSNNNTIDLKSLTKSIQLKKANNNSQPRSQQPIKKSVSRKTRCISIKQTCTSVKQTSTQPLGQIKYKQLLKKFEELKNIQQKTNNNRSKSKSTKSFLQMTIKPKSPVSGTKNKSSKKKFNLTALMNKNLNTQNSNKLQQTLPHFSNNNKTQFNSRSSLPHKLNKTLKKIHLKQYFDKDEQDSLIPFISTSQMGNNGDNDQDYPNKNKQYFISNNQLNQDDYINIYQMRKYCKTIQNVGNFYQDNLNDLDMIENKNIRNNFMMKKNINYFRGDQYQMMAVRIQRAWRRYRTKKLVQRYADIIYQKYVDNQNQEQDDQEADVDQMQYENQNNQQQHKNYYGDQSSDYSNNLIKFQNQQILANSSNSNNSINNDSKFTNNNNNNFKKYNLDLDDITDSIIQRKQNNYLQRQEELEEIISSRQQKSTPQQQSYRQEEVMIKIQQLYPQNLINQEHLVTYISNLDSQQDHQQLSSNKNNEKEKNYSINNNLIGIQMEKQKSVQKKQTNKNLENAQYEKIINQIKINQLQKWKEIIQILQKSKNKKNPQQLQNLLNQLVQHSQRNKKQLQVIQTNQIINSSKNKSKKMNTQSDQFVIKKRQASGPSQNSDLRKQEPQFDSKKYIQYLDSDMFIFEKDRSSENSQLLFHDQRLGKRISQRKQKQLLAILNTDQVPIRLRSHNVSKSQNLSYLFQDQQNNNIIPVNPRLTRCISEKNIQKVIRSISPQLNYEKNDQQQEDQDQLNLDLIRQQFLQNADPIQQLDKLHSHTELKKKIKQSRQNYNGQKQTYFNLQDSSDQQQPKQPIRINLDISKNFNLNRSSSKDLSMNTTLNNQSEKPNDILVQNVNKNVEQVEQNNQQDQKNYKNDNVFIMIFNYLIFEVLKDMASYDSILQKFKQYSQNMKSNKKQAKKGFLTSHQQVKSFVQGLVAFIKKQEADTFKNLQVPAGPTALQMLNYLHPNQEEQQVSQQSQDQISVMVIPDRMFNKFWQIREKQLFNQNQSQNALNNVNKKKTNFDLLKGLNKIFCRSIFDSFGECLDFQRNFGQAGKPYPWKRSTNFYHKKTEIQIQKSIQNAQKRIYEVSTTYCGLILQKSDMVKISIQGSDQYINHIQQDRMSRMLAQDLIQNQERWTFYDDQELQLLVEISNIIILLLVVEACDQISRIG